jgi:hypothetical protein
MTALPLRTTARETPRAKRASTPGQAHTPPSPDAVSPDGPTVPEMSATRRSPPRRALDLGPEPPLAPTQERASAPIGNSRYSVVPPRAATRFATLDRYLDGLPEGVDSYPNLMTRGALARLVLRDPVHTLPLDAGLPKGLEDLVRRPPSVSAWIPLVQLCALLAASFDVIFADRGGLPAYEAWSFELHRRVLGGPLNRALIAMEGPERLVANYRSRWSAFHRGTLLDVMSLDTEGRLRGAALRISYPRHAWPHIALIGLGAGLRATLVLAGAKAPEVTWKHESAVASRYDVHFG